MTWLHRITALIRKELQILFADRQSRQLVIIPVVLQVILFPLAVTLEVKNTTLAVLDEDGGQVAHELTERFRAASSFTSIIHLIGTDQIAPVMDEQKAIALVHFGPDFSARVESRQAAPIQVILDGRRSNSSQIAASYIQEILIGYFNEKYASQGGKADTEIIVQNRYNPNLDYQWFILPSLVAIILTVSALILTALSVAREREQGTLDQLLVSPLTPEMIMIGKAAAVLVVGLFQASVIMVAAVFVYRVPMSGSLLLIYGSSILYFMALVGIGFLISAMCATQQQAFLGAFAFMMPSILLSGIASPIENMPQWMQTMTWINPVRHFMFIVKSIFLKDASFCFAIMHSLPLILTGTITLALAVFIYRKRFG